MLHLVKSYICYPLASVVIYEFAIPGLDCFDWNSLLYSVLFITIAFQVQKQQGTSINLYSVINITSIDALPAEITRNSPVVEQFGFITWCSEQKPILKG